MDIFVTNLGMVVEVGCVQEKAQGDETEKGMDLFQFS